MSFTYSTKELQELEKMLEMKLFSLKAAQQSASAPPGELDELSLTTNILKFVQYLVNREMTDMGFWRQSPLAATPYTFGYGSYPNVSSISVSLADTSTICENCRMKNPSNTHCVHKVTCGDVQDYGDCDCGTNVDAFKAVKAEPPKK
jgi:hypothetical protein